MRAFKTRAHTAPRPPLYTLRARMLEMRSVTPSDLRRADYIYVRPRASLSQDHKFYDELIFDAGRFTRDLPRSIEAVFYIHGSCNDVGDNFNHNAACEPYARRAHANILRRFHLSAERLPLLRLDLFNWNAPFSDGTLSTHPAG